jgi:hypothetical protein
MLMKTFEVIHDMWSDVQVLESHYQKSKVGNLDKDKYAKRIYGRPDTGF